MNPSELTDHALDALLRTGTPGPLADDGFVARTMAAVDVATLAMPAPRRATRVAPLAIARALAAEQRHHAAQARLWRWAIAGVIAGFVLLLAAVLLSPSDVAITAPSPAQWFPLLTLAAFGAAWIAWRELRDS